MLSFFYKENTGGGLTAGYQIGTYLGSKLNPSSGYENDTCIYVKIIPQNYPKHSYLDVVDSVEAVDWLRYNPDIGVIARSTIAQEYLSKLLKRNDIKYIPQFHCNFEGYTRVPREVRVAGTVGALNSLQCSLIELEKMLKEIGVELDFDRQYWPHYNNQPNELGIDAREKICNFYKGLDVQIVWRTRAWSPKHEPLKSNTKLINAGSFGVPTIAYPEPSFVKDWDGAFIAVNNLEEMIESIKHLKDDPNYYKIMSDKALTKSKEYDIEKIAQLYLAL